MTTNKRRKTIGMVIAGGALLAVAAAGVAYAIRTALIDQGGEYAESSTYEMRASVGGAVAGESESTTYRIRLNAVSVVQAAADPVTGPDTGPGTTPTPETTSLTGGGCAASAGDSGGAALAFVAYAIAMLWARAHRRMSNEAA